MKHTEQVSKDMASNKIVFAMEPCDRRSVPSILDGASLLSHIGYVCNKNLQVDTYTLELHTQPFQIILYM